MTSAQLYPWIAVAAGGAVGASLRYWISAEVNRLGNNDFPWGTLAVNLIGSFLFGVITIMASKYAWLGHNTRLLLLTGGLGALTTFSTFSSDTLQLIYDGKPLLAGSNILMNVVICIFAVWLGMQLANRL